MPYHPLQKKIIRRPTQTQEGHFPDLPPLLRRIYLARNLTEAGELDRTLAKLPSPWLLSGMENLVDHLLQAIQSQSHILIVADFDADGATSCAVGMLGLKAMGAEKVSYIVPNRFEYGYGLTPEIVAVAARQKPDVLITVDNGISSIEGVMVAKNLGIKVLVTDHHLPGAQLPQADAIVNPNLPGDEFPSKFLAGVGVMFYVLMALRMRLREKDWFTRSGIAEPNLGQWLDLVALGTVADVVTLDRVNRILVHQGLQRIRQGQGRPGIVALIEVAGRKSAAIAATDLGFVAAPRLNAAGRLEDMGLGIQCLLSESAEQARGLAARLDQLNRERRTIEEQMKQDAYAFLDHWDTGPRTQDRAGFCLFDPSWHQGVIGILASRIKDRTHRPVIAFAPAGDGEIKGSARSIPGVHIRDLLSDIAAGHPSLLSRFGGHAMAAGLSLEQDDFPAFAEIFDAEVRKHLVGLDLDHAVHSDGELSPEEMRLESAELLQQAGPWGQGFPEPLFDGEFEVVQTRIVGEKHLKLVLKTRDQQRMIDGIAFFVDDPDRWLGCRRLKLAYKLDVNEFRDNRSVQLRIEYMETC
ncbi:MAG: single-stranded-DNA-specific exonuclease RecJ [Methylococcaceae bacterium]|nr:single-stranded-DNA-specific exonuclease RecJ [Methylococcaceae bacterium]